MPITRHMHIQDRILEFDPKENKMSVKKLSQVTQRPDEYWVAYMNSSSERWHIYVDIADDEAQAYKPDEEAPSGYFVCKLDLTALGPMEKIYRRRKKLQFIHVLKTLHKTRRSDHKE